MSINIAIDGPVASGKGAVTKGLAKKLGISALDTGAAYRAVALFLLDNDIDIYDEKRILLTLKKIDLRLFPPKIMICVCLPKAKM
ncbi:MAG: (d)CMP kinase [Clostridia bacterium]|nr:(d)CMP kinase [Clostridia bacterium]